MLAVAAATLAAAVVPAVAVAAATASPIVIDSVSSPPDEPGLLSIQVEATSSITSLSVELDSGGTTELTIPFSDLSLTSGGAQDGIWTVQTPITTAQLGLGTYQVSVTATDSGGDDLSGLSAPEPFFFGLYPALTINASTTTLSYSQQSVTFSGQVTAYSPAGLLEGVPDQQVTITDGDGGSWSATTDDIGNYLVTATPDLADGSSLAGSFAASVASSATIAAASSPSLELTGQISPVQVSVTLSKAMADFGTPVTLSGTAQYESDGIWLPLTYSAIDVTGTDYYSGDSVSAGDVTTDGSGDFSVVLPAQPTTTWSANAAPNQYLTPAVSELGLPNSATLTVVLPTEARSLKVSYNPAGQVVATGCLGLGSAVSSFPDLTAPADADIYLQYSRTADGPWHTLGSLTGRNTPACRTGTPFQGALGSTALSGQYRLDFAGQLLYQPSVSSPAYAATVPTRFSSFRITPRAVTGHGRITVSGVLQQKSHGWKALRGALVTIYIEPAGGTTWYWVKKVHASSTGKFSISFADPASGHWAVGYAGNSTHLETVSRIIDVTASGTSNSLSATGTHALSGRAGRRARVLLRAR
jgi:hypothetical protein